MRQQDRVGNTGLRRVELRLCPLGLPSLLSRAGAHASPTRAASGPGLSPQTCFVPPMSLGAGRGCRRVPTAILGPLFSALPGVSSLASHITPRGGTGNLEPPWLPLEPCHGPAPHLTAEETGNEGHGSQQRSHRAGTWSVSPLAIAGLLLSRGPWELYLPCRRASPACLAFLYLRGLWPWP